MKKSSPNVPRRSPGFPRFSRIPKDADIVIPVLYCEEKLSLREIAKIVSCSVKTVKALLVASGVKIRTRSEAVRLKWTEEDYIRKLCPDRGRRKLRVGDRAISDIGYVLVYHPDPTGKRSTPFLKEHRVVASRCLRRNLKSNDQVHHKDCRKTNNSPDNLFIFLTKELHDQYHLRFGRVPWSQLPLRLRSKAKRFFSKYATPVTEFRLWVKQVGRVLVKFLGNLLESLIGFLSPVRARDGPPIPAAECLKE